ncbi:hypothetical protein T8S45_03295 [Blastomonas marina]|uniref:Uncharacterized protein n=1 Tax=Blastomonas marina TaxID=1867408 RepID=A0ABQ1F8D4_9SPHN|nr:hypothetical protein [Blastomonas marina]WPZ04579.1 hypothetical protein T8S45_03295 [Blastomonas marina]GGA02820.1 hypothetical protein GCM10010923_09560 [Blastomonas marina]
MFEDRHFEFDESTATEIHAVDALVTPVAAPPVAPANQGFQLPARVWLAMLGCYAAFFTALAIATSASGKALFAIAISVLYTAIYFGVARIGAAQAGPEAQSPLDCGEPLQTWTGPMDAISVYAQILIVPLAVAGFGIGVAVIALVTA